MRVSKGNLTEECVGDGVFVYALERGGVRAVFSNWGATLMSLCVPDAQGEIGDIVLGFDTLGPYMVGPQAVFVVTRDEDDMSSAHTSDLEDEDENDGDDAASWITVDSAEQRGREVNASPMTDFERANLTSWARLLAQSGNVLDLVDSNVQSVYCENQAVSCITVALLCLQRLPAARPSMSDVVKILSGERALPDLPFEFSPSPPEFKSPGSRLLRKLFLIRLLPLSNGFTTQHRNGNRFKSGLGW